LYLILDKGYCNVAGECYLTVVSQGKHIDQSWINQRACYGGDNTYFRMPDSFQKSDMFASWGKTAQEVKNEWIATCLAESNGCGSTKCHFDGILQWEYRWIFASVIFLWVLCGIACLGCVPVTTCFAKEEYTEEGRASYYNRGTYEAEVTDKEEEMVSTWDRGDGLPPTELVHNEVTTVMMEPGETIKSNEGVYGDANAPMSSGKSNGKDQNRLCGCVNNC